MSGEVKRYSESFKLHVVRELERGRYRSIAEVSRAFEIRGQHTVRDWVVRYGKNHLLKKVVRVEKPGEQSRVKRLQEENERLRTALVDAVLDKAYFELVCEQHGIDAEAFKKKADAKLSGKGPSKKARP